jgi:alpha-tubulin suppressor-like RCC1 family protein
VPAQAGTGELKTASFKGANLAIKEDGTLWAWGSNESGQLGLGYTSQFVSSPTQVGTSSDWSTVVSDGYAVLAFKLDGTLWAWGDNRDGRLGLGYTDGVVIFPTQVGTDSDWASVHAKYGLNLGIKMDGTLWAWGYNNYGQAGQGATGSNISVPTQIGADSDWKYAVSDGSGVLALKTDGSLWAWGANWDGRLGLGHYGGFVDAPTEVRTDGAWESVSAVYASVTNGFKFRN